jgi:hypothetical protein
MVDSVRQAKADLALAPVCPDKSMAPVLAIADMVARGIDVAVPLTPLERFFNLSSPGRTWILILRKESRNASRQRVVA